MPIFSIPQAARKIESAAGGFPAILAAAPLLARAPLRARVVAPALAPIFAAAPALAATASPSGAEPVLAHLLTFQLPESQLLHKQSHDSDLR